MKFTDKNFTINGKITDGKLNLTMKVFQEKHINTKNIPATIPVLNNNLPSIFKCQCFNDDKKEFTEECQQTELGHLFEHIMLEYLCLEKINSGNSEAIYEGVTKWNWEEEEFGTFNIQINTSYEDFKNIKGAFFESIKLLGKILS